MTRLWADDPVFLTEYHAMKTYWGSGGIAPRIHDLGTRWRWVVSFTPRPLYTQGKSPWYPLDRRAPEPFWTQWWREKFPAPSGTRTPDHSVRNPALYRWAIPAPGSTSGIFNSWQGQWRISFLPGSDRLWGPSSLLSNEYQWPFLGE
jgi:hypothetical protein